jgi:hypothetical protein
MKINSYDNNASQFYDLEYYFGNYDFNENDNNALLKYNTRI